MDNETIYETSFQPDDSLYNKKIVPVPAQQPQIGVDLNNVLLQDIVDAAQVSKFDASQIQSFTNVSRNRNELYDTLDYMAQDTTLASVLETYAEDATETNDSGDIVWCESDDPAAGKFVTYLLGALGVNKNVFKWTYNLCKYGDVYLRLYRESEVEDRFFKPTARKKTNNSLNEDVNVRAYASSDKYVHYLEQAPNPAQLFELTRFGKTAGYVKTNIQPTNVQNDNLNNIGIFDNRYRFNSDSNDVDLYPATEWVHGCLESDSSRTPEVVELFTQDAKDQSSEYTVRRGESLLYDSYKTWRELMLLENSVLLQRVTQSSIVRVIGVEVGDMPKENVQPHLMNIKHLIEQKAALDVGRSMSEYSNPGPIVNNIYIPTRNNQGVISTQQIGGDVNVGELVDLAYYEDKLFGGLRVPKQYFGRTDDAAGFNGGTSLSLISSRYAKMIKRIQNVITQMLTDAINLILIDTENEEYINKFTLRMLAPTTQEEVDRRENLSNKMALINDVMAAVGDISDTTKRLKILKSMLSDTITNAEVIALIQEEIDTLEIDAAEEKSDSLTDEEPLDSSYSDEEDLSMLFGDTLNPEDAEAMGMTQPDENIAPAEETGTLPSPAELGAGDFSDATNPEFEF